MDQIEQDLEAFPLPPNHDGIGESSSSAAPMDEPQERPRVSTRKKIMAAAVTIAVVVAVGIGVALSTGGGGSPATEQAGAMQNTDNQGVVIDLGDETSAAEPEPAITQPADEELFAEETPADESNTELPSNETPEGEQAAAATLDDETLGVILDAGKSAEPPIYSGGIDRPVLESTVHETTEAKVPFNSEDFSVDALEYQGPTSDFISTDLARIVTTSSTCADPSQQGMWRMDLTTDQYPWETYWNMTNSIGDVVAFGPPAGYNYNRNTRYVGVLCHQKGMYKLNFGDKNKDGICCAFGNGSMVMKINGEVKADTDDSSFELKEFSFRIRQENYQEGNTPSPTKKPTNSPTKKPTPPIIPGSKIPVEIKMKTDMYTKGETSYKLVKVGGSDAGKVYAKKNKGQLPNSGELTTDELLLDPGSYRFTITDTLKGLEGGGYYAVKVDGQEVLYGGGQFETDSAVIRVGHTPPMTENESMWLEEHNLRRREFQLANDVPAADVKELVWSTELAQAADDWIDKITPTCIISGNTENPAEGENISAHSTNGEKDEGPKVIMKRWVENKSDKPYPNNRSMTQVHWRGSRYVGCAQRWAFKKNADGTDKNSRCYVSICRYARAGNCSTGQFKKADGSINWLEAVLKERHACGPMCPSNSCY